LNGVTKQKNASNYFWTALPNKRTRPITFGRRFQTKERVQLLWNGVFSSFIGSNPILPVRYGTIRRPTRAVWAACRIYFASAQEGLPPCSDCRGIVLGRQQKAGVKAPSTVRHGLRASIAGLPAAAQNRMVSLPAGSIRFCRWRHRAWRHSAVPGCFPATNIVGIDPELVVRQPLPGVWPDQHISSSRARNGGTQKTVVAINGFAGPSLMSKCAGAQDRADHTAGVTFRIRLL